MATGLRQEATARQAGAPFVEILPGDGPSGERFARSFLTSGNPFNHGRSFLPVWPPSMRRLSSSRMARGRRAIFPLPVMKRIETRFGVYE
jgi:hypothetical protein